MITSFKPQFLESLNKGVKIHTIREDKHNRWRPGMLMHHATGVRTKNYRLLKLTSCVSVQSIKMSWHFVDDELSACIFIDGVLFYSKFAKIDKGLALLAINDGFETITDFYRFFNPWLRTNFSDFNGRILHWTNQLY